MVEVSPFLEKLVSGWTFVLEKYLSNIFIAVIYILGGLVLGKIAQTVTVYVLREVEVRKIIKHIGIKKVDKFAGIVVAWVIYVVSVFAALNLLGIAFIIIYIIGFIAILLIAGSFVFGFRSFFPNFFYGFSLRRSPALERGRTVNMSGIRGKVKKVGLVDVVLTEDDGELLFVPNRTFFKKLRNKLDTF